jgi:hypothetical protein
MHGYPYLRHEVITFFLAICPFKVKFISQAAYHWQGNGYACYILDTIGHFLQIVIDGKRGESTKNPH